MKKTIAQAGPSTFDGKRVLVRVDFNVPLNDDCTVADYSRIKAAIPTIDYLRKAGAKVILMSHLGRPKGPSEKLSLKPVAEKLAELLKAKVAFAKECVGEEAEKVVNGLKSGEVCLLENLRFHAEEEKNDKEFAKKLGAQGGMPQREEVERMLNHE